MRIAVASGKGGSGKTTVAVNLALTAPGEVTLLDCDVEEPNCHLFLPAPSDEESREIPVSILTPGVDEGKCTACGACGELCRYHAIVSLKTRPMLFPELCHGCGGCARVCPEKAIGEVEHPVGTVREARIGGIRLIQGRLNVGEAMAPPVIRALKGRPGQAGTVILDAPPGTSCPVIASITGATAVLVVTEPTPAGEHDLGRALSLVRHFGLPAAVCVNKYDINPEMTERIEALALREGALPAGRVRYDDGVTLAQRAARTVVEGESGAAKDIQNLWDSLSSLWQLPPRKQEGTKEKYMRIAFPLAGGKLAMHFGHCERFALIDVDESSRTIVRRQELIPPAHEPGVLPRWLAEQKADVIIAGGMGRRAQDLFTRNGIRVCVGVDGQDPEDLAAAYLAGTLSYGDNTCDH